MTGHRAMVLFAALGSLCLLAAGCSSEDARSRGGEPDSGTDGAEAGPSVVMGCGVPLLQVPEDPGARGPWPVGNRAVTLAGLPTEIWYPARPGSDRDAAATSYDLRDYLPPAEAAKIPDADAPPQECECFADLPIDDDRGPYPVVVFVHGTASFRTQSLSQMHHWASRGFVVVASDIPKLKLADFLVFDIGADAAGDTGRALDALSDPTGDVAFLAGRIDMDRVGLVGHSAGGGAIARHGDRAGVRVIAPLASGGVAPGAHVESTLIMGGLADSVVAYTRQVDGYATSPRAKRLVGIDTAGHLAFSDICALRNAEGQNILEIAAEHAVTNAQLAGVLFDGCGAGFIDPLVARAIVNHATTIALEERLKCTAAGDALAGIAGTFPLVTDYRAEL